MTKPQHEQDYETLKALLNVAENSETEIIGVTGYSANLAFPCLTRLHSEAAKVPGLEQRAKDDAALLESRNSDLAQALSERDAAQKEAKDLAKVAEQMLAERNATEAEAEALRERVATLEENEKALIDSALESENARVAAEERVKELERERDEAAREALRRLASRLGDDATGYDRTSSAEELEVAIFRFTQEREQVAREESQPQPAPAQGVDEDVEAVRAGLIDGREGTSVRSGAWAALGRLQERLATPTPPPGLREAVGLLERVVEEVARETPPALRLAADYESPAAQAIRNAWDASAREVLRRFRAAYDATKGGGR